MSQKIQCEAGAFGWAFNEKRKTKKKPADNLIQIAGRLYGCFDRSAAKWSRWEKREELGVLRDKPLNDLGVP